MQKRNQRLYVILWKIVEVTKLSGTECGKKIEVGGVNM